MTWRTRPIRRARQHGHLALKENNLAILAILAGARGFLTFWRGDFPRWPSYLYLAMLAERVAL